MGESVGAVARTGLTIAGAYFFGPVGALVGGLIGSYLFPVENNQQGPRLQEINVQRATIGAPIPIAYGTVKLAGNIIFHGGLIEEATTEEAGGKGAPSSSITEFAYFVDLAIGICDGEDGRPSKP